MNKATPLVGLLLVLATACGSSAATVKYSGDTTQQVQEWNSSTQYPSLLGSDTKSVSEVMSSAPLSEVRAACERSETDTDLALDGPAIPDASAETWWKKGLQANVKGDQDCILGAEHSSAIDINNASAQWATSNFDIEHVNQIVNELTD